MLKKEINSHNPSPILLLSSEIFYLLSPPEKVAQFMRQIGFKKGRIKILIYLRRQDEAHLSWYNQRVKTQGYYGTLEESIAESRDLWNYGSRLAAWEKEFGKKSIIVKPYKEEKLQDHDIRKETLSTLKIPQTNFVFSNKKQNEKINYEIMQFQLKINRLPLQIFEKRHFHKELISISKNWKANKKTKPYSLISPSTRKKLLKEYAKENKKILQRYPQCKCLFEPDSASYHNSSKSSSAGLSKKQEQNILKKLEKHAGDSIIFKKIKNLIKIK